MPYWNKQNHECIINKYQAEVREQTTSMSAVLPQKGESRQPGAIRCLQHPESTCTSLLC